LVLEAVPPSSDGFTLTDLVAYDAKSEDAGVVGRPLGPAIPRPVVALTVPVVLTVGLVVLLARQQRNFLATLCLSQGVPMLLGGDEVGRSQRGNNNAYCQDNELSWYDWEHADHVLLEFTRRLIALRREHPVFHRRRWFQDRPLRVTDIGWFALDGQEMSEEQWTQVFAKSLGVFLNGEAIASRGPQGDRIRDDSFYVLFNAHHEPLQSRCRLATGVAVGDGVRYL
jgi:glycogen operon protein